VFNLIINVVEAMSGLSDRERAPAALYFNSGYLSIQTLHRDWPSGWSLYLRDKTASTVATVHFRVWPIATNFS
jgi:hypothetical protein